MKNKISYILLCLFILFSCNVNTNKNTQGETGDIKKSLTDKEKNYFEDVIIQTIEGFTSSIEIAAIIQDMNVPYSQKYLVPTDAVENYDTNFKKALGLGMLSVDLGYLNVYKKMNSNIQYLSAIKKISDDLDIEQFFDFQTLKRLAVNNDDVDSLMYLSVSSYNKMNHHLIETDRSYLSALVVAGVWIEGLYITCEVYDLQKNDVLKDRIADQKEILDTLLNLLIFFQDKAHFNDIIDDLIKLKQLYKGIEIKTIKTKAEIVENKDGMPVVYTQDETTEIIVTDEQLKNIANFVTEIRNKRTKID